MIAIARSPNSLDLLLTSLHSKQLTYFRICCCWIEDWEIEQSEQPGPIFWLTGYDFEWSLYIWPHTQLWGSCSIVTSMRFCTPTDWRPSNNQDCRFCRVNQSRRNPKWVCQPTKSWQHFFCKMAKSTSINLKGEESWMENIRPTY